MTRQEVLDWLSIDDEQLDRLLERGLPAEGHGQYSMNDVAAWLNANGLTEQPVVEPTLPPGVVKTRREAARALGRSIVTIDGWIAQGCPGENGHYDVAAMQRWRDARDRQLKRPSTYGTGARGQVSDADLDELREIVKREIDHESGTHYHAVCEAIVAVLKLGHVLPEDINERRKLLIEAICPPFKPWITGEADMSAKVEERMAEVLECLPQ